LIAKKLVLLVAARLGGRFSTSDGQENIK